MNELVAKQQLITYIKGKINLSLADEEVISYSFQLKHLEASMLIRWRLLQGQCLI